MVDVSGDEELDVGRGTRWPRWLTVTALAVLAAGVAAAVAARGGHDPHPAPSATTSPVTPPTGRADALAVSAQRGTFYELADRRLRSFTPDGRTLQRSATVQAAPSPSAPVVLEVDDAAGLLWVVPIEGAVPGYVESYTLDGLKRTARVPLPETIGGAAALDGSLYIVRSGQVSVLRRGTTAFEQIVGSAVVSIAADPSRHRLIAALLGVGSFDDAGLGVISPEGRVSRETPLPFGITPQLAVVAGTVWFNGPGGGEFLARIDPTTLAAGSGVLQTAGNVNAALIGTGDSSLFLRDGTVVHCVPTRPGGRIVDLAVRSEGLVATRHAAWTADGVDPPRRVDLGGCAG